MPRFPGWPGETDWESTAYRWLIDQAPGAWRDGHQFREHCLILVRDLRYLLDGYVQALRRAYSRARIEELLDMYRTEGPRLRALVRQVQIVEDALSGIRWVPRRADADWSKLE